MGNVERANVTHGTSTQRAAAAASAASATSRPSSASHRPASRRVSTPIEQPTSTAHAKRASGSAASVAAYLACSYALVVNPHGSARSA